MSFDKEMIRVYNYAPCSVAVPIGKDGSVLIEGTDDPLRPGMETFRFSDLEYIHTHTKVLSAGALEFDEEEREEIYAALRAHNWKETCFFEGDIDSLLMDASLANMERVLGVKDIYTIDRICAHMEKLIASHSVDVSSRVQTVVNARRKELYEDIVNSKIQLIPKAKEEKLPDITNAEIEDMVAKKVAETLANMSKTAPEPVKEEEAVPKAQQETVKKAAVKTVAIKKAPAKKPAVKKTSAKTNTAKA